MKVRFAVGPGGFLAEERLGSWVEQVERLGFDGIWLSDVPVSPVLDPLVGLAYAAATTSRLRLGANLVPLGRHPYLLAKQLAEIDRLSQGRLLLSMVPGLGQPAERETLGTTGHDRGILLEEAIALMRRWWAGEAVDHHDSRWQFSDLGPACRPWQDPLEVWLGGIGPKALARAGRIADGWLGAAVTPTEAGQARQRIEAAASAAGRQIDPEHFGLSIGYAVTAPDDAVLAGLRVRRPDADPRQLVPAGRSALRSHVLALIDEGLSKFVVRPTGAPGTDAIDGLDWLADAVLDLQT